MVQSVTLAYVSRDGRKLLADIFTPPGRGPFPGIVLLHGGAFTKGSRSSCHPWARYLAAHDARTFSGQMARRLLDFLTTWCGWS